MEIKPTITEIRAAAGRLGGLAPHKQRGGGFHRMRKQKRSEIGRLGAQARKRMRERLEINPDPGSARG